MNSQSWLRDVAGGTDGFGGVSPMKTRFRANWRFWSLPVKNRPRINVQEQRNEATPTLGYPPNRCFNRFPGPSSITYRFNKFCLKNRSQGLSSTCYPCPRTPVTLDSGLYRVEGWEETRRGHSQSSTRTAATATPNSKGGQTTTPGLSACVICNSPMTPNAQVHPRP